MCLLSDNAFSNVSELPCVFRRSSFSGFVVSIAPFIYFRYVDGYELASGRKLVKTVNLPDAMIFRDPVYVRPLHGLLYFYMMFVDVNQFACSWYGFSTSISL